MKTITFILTLIAIVCTSCSVEPQPINYGVDDCTLCRMKITEEKFGAEILTKKGKVLKFDSGECMINYLNQNSAEEINFESYLVIDYANPSKLIDAKKAFWLHGENINSPMGGNISAFEKQESAEAIKCETGSQLLNWNEVIKLEL